jgi:hypothetical protein
VSWAGIIALFVMGVFYSGWFIFGFLLLIMGARHPPPLNDITPLDRKRWAVGGVAVAILLTAFVVIPLSPPSGSFSVTTAVASTPANATMGVVGNATLTIMNADQVPHGYLLAASINEVDQNASGTSRPYSPANLSSFERNSTWVVSFPNGNQTTIAGTGNFSLPTASYLALGPGQRGTVEVRLLNPVSAQVLFTVEVGVLCGGGANQAFHFQVE